MINISHTACSWRNKTSGIHLKFCKRKKYFNRTINYKHVGTYLPPTSTEQFRLPSQGIPLILYNMTVHCRRCNVPYLPILPPDGTCLPIFLPSFRFFSSVTWTFSFQSWLRSWFAIRNGAKLFLVLVVLNYLSVGIRWVSVSVLVFGREICIGVWERVMYWCLGQSYVLVFGRELCMYSFVVLKPCRILYVFSQCNSVKENFNFMGHSVISLFGRLSILTFGVFLTAGTESFPKRYLQRRRFSASSFNFQYPLGRNFWLFLIL